MVTYYSHNAIILQLLILKRYLNIESQNEIVEIFCREFLYTKLTGNLNDFQMCI